VSAGRMGTVGDLRQFWLRQLGIAGASLVLFAIFLWLAWAELQVIPRDALEALFTASATLLGLTFTAFSILATFIPGLRKDFVQSRTFSTMGQTFVLTMAAELLTLVLSGASFLASGRPGIEYVALASLLFAILSVGFLAQLAAYMSSLFKMARSQK
jgi:hypothetical protein